MLFDFKRLIITICRPRTKKKKNYQQMNLKLKGIYSPFCCGINSTCCEMYELIISHNKSLINLNVKCVFN